MSNIDTEDDLPFEEPDEAEIAEMAEQVFATIPDELRNFVKGIAFHVQEFADDDILDEMEIEDPYDLLGLYQGVSLAHESVGSIHIDVNRIFLFREPILEYAYDTGEPLDQVIRHVLIHEIGHHFGLSDEDMDRIERADEDYDDKDRA